MREYCSSLIQRKLNLIYFQLKIHFFAYVLKYTTGF